MQVAQIDTAEQALAPGAFDEIIDVRSPSEFAEDHLPGAISLPVLDDAERARVGTLYVQVSKFDAKKIGAALISRNVARHLETHLADKPGGYRPLVYCWRGGQRSGAMAHILAQIGWRVTTLQGGYKRYRRHVSERLYGAPLGLRIALLDGLTGSAKTEILERLRQRGRAVIDLEGLAAHRGSVFGADPDRPQPSQKMFESRLLQAIKAAQAQAGDGYVLVEAESNLIGDLKTPPSLWTAMQAAPTLWIEAFASERAAYSERRYADMVADPAHAAETLGRLTYRHGKEQVAAWRALLAAGETRLLIQELLLRHYDPAYARAAKRLGRDAVATVTADKLDEDGIESAADAVEAALKRLEG